MTGKGLSVEELGLKYWLFLLILNEWIHPKNWLWAVRDILFALGIIIFFIIFIKNRIIELYRFNLILGIQLIKFNFND